MLTIIALEGRSLHDQQQENNYRYKQKFPVFLLYFGNESNTPLRRLSSHHDQL
jgi:hypothetical protein